MPDNKKEKIKKPEMIAHTYAEDLAEEIKKEQGGAYRVALEEEKRKEEDKKEFSPLSKQNLLFSFSSLFLLLLAAGLIFFVFWQGNGRVAPPPEGRHPATPPDPYHPSPLTHHPSRT